MKIPKMKQGEDKNIRVRWRNESLNMKLLN